MSANSLLKRVYKSVEPQSVWRWRMHYAFREEIEGGGDKELSELNKIVRKGRVALDIGANRGVYSYKLAEICSKVIAFEPNPEVAETLRRLKRSNVEVRDIALSDKDGTAELTIPASKGLHGFATMRSGAFEGPENRRISIATKRLDDLDLPPLDFIKIDVEGFEEPVITGGMETLDKDRPAMFIEIEQRHCDGIFDRLPAQLSKLGYKGYFLDEGAWRTFESFDVERDQLAALDRDGVIREGAQRYINNFLFLAGGRQPPYH